MRARFHVPDAERIGEVVDLPPEEAEHLVRVLRLKAGAAARVFNGRGAEFDAVVETITKFRAQVRLQAQRDPQREARIAVTLVQAVLKGDKMDDVVRDAVMMGVVAIQPVVTTRSEVALASLRRRHRQERWQRMSVSSAKQCGRAVVPMVFEPRAFEDVAAAIGNSSAPGQTLMFVEPSASARVVSLAALDADPPRASTIFVGPEGGWTSDEVTRGSSIGGLVTLGSRTLRADAMALVAVTALLTYWREL